MLSMKNIAQHLIIVKEKNSLDFIIIDREFFYSEKKALSYVSLDKNHSMTFAMYIN